MESLKILGVLLFFVGIAVWAVWVSQRAHERNEPAKRAERKEKAAAYRQLARHRRSHGSA
jgi:hypothetical protein